MSPCLRHVPAMWEQRDSLDTAIYSVYWATLLLVSAITLSWTGSINPFHAVYDISRCGLWVAVSLIATCFFSPPGF
jgi:hypothetical protein